MNRNHALAFISIFVVAAGGALFACSSSSTTITPGVTTDSGVHDTGSVNSDTGPVTDSGTVDDTAPAADTGLCSKIGSLHPPSEDAGGKTIYCPFSSVGDAGNESCYGGNWGAEAGVQHCCETPASAGTPSTCQAEGTACPVAKSMDWGCQDPVSDCPTATPVCCAPGASIGLGTTGCGNYAKSMKNTTCVAAGACTGIVMCTSDGECPTGQKCTAFGKAGAQVGGCM